MPSASELDYVSTKRQRIAELAKQSPQMGFTSLAHHIDLRWLSRSVRANAAERGTGRGRTDGDATTTRICGDNLRSLLERAKSGTYRAPPVRRVHIPKGTGPETRPIGIPTFEDKSPSAGGRHGVGSCLRAGLFGLFVRLSTRTVGASGVGRRLWKQTMRTRGGWILEVDIRKFFDTLDHAHLRRIASPTDTRRGVVASDRQMAQRGRSRRRELVRIPDQGSPQGGVISPLLANVYLHYVLDVWFEQEVQAASAWARRFSFVTRTTSSSV